MLLAVNGGSSSLKLMWTDNDGKELLVAKWSKTTKKVSLEGTITAVVSFNEQLADLIFKKIITWINCKNIFKGNTVDKLGYRFVHGGNIFNNSTPVTKDLLEQLKMVDSYAPLHNPMSRSLVSIGISLFPKASHFLFFDTTFHKTIPKVAKIYGIDLKYYNIGIKKYGFHGLSHEYVSRKAASSLGMSVETFSGIIVHLGNGSSITAVKNGKSIDTTMGYTPNEGLIMGERSGSIDSGVIQAICKFENMDVDTCIDFLNKHSGFKGITGYSDYIQVKEAAKAGDEKSKLALELLAYQIRLRIGSYLTLLDKVDAVVFTGGIGENDYDLIENIFSTSAMRRIFYSYKKNIPIMQIKTNEEKAIIDLLLELK